MITLSERQPSIQRYAVYSEKEPDRREKMIEDISFWQRQPKLVHTSLYMKLFRVSLHDPNIKLESFKYQGLLDITCICNSSADLCFILPYCNPSDLCSLFSTLMFFEIRSLLGRKSFCPFNVAFFPTIPHSLFFVGLPYV